MQKVKTFWWWCRTKFFGLNGPRSSQKLLVPAIDEIEAERKIDKRLGGLDCWQKDGSVEGPYETEKDAAHYAKIRD